MRAYRGYVLGEKRRIAGLRHTPQAFRRGARGLMHYLDYVHEYLEAKRDVLMARSSAWQEHSPDKGEVPSSRLGAPTKFEGV